jgi:hypothetical protein
LDLFTDAPATNLVNAITQALIDRDPSEARRQLERLYVISPDHIRLGDLERLVEATELLPTAVSDVSADLRMLQEVLTPLADALLGKSSRNLLIPLWRRLSAAVQDRPYRSTEPEQHLSYTAYQAMDWDTVRQAVERETQWQSAPLLLLRHAQACDHLHQHTQALHSWFPLCWRFSEQTDAIASCTHHELRQQWAAFLDLEPELPVESFPAWMLITKPGLTQRLPEPASAPASYITLYRLQHNRLHAADNEHTIALRTQLKQQDPLLFQHFLANVGKS